MKKWLGTICALMLGAVGLFGQGAGAIKTQEIYSSTGQVHVYGNLLANPFITTATGEAASGAVRLANNDKICWRNAAGTGDICIFIDGSDAFNIQANTTILGDLNVTGNITGGSVTGGGTVTSVGLTGDGTVLNTTVTNSPVTTSGTMALTLANANSNTVLAGPVGASGTNVAIRQDAQVQATGTNPTLAYTNSVQSGSVLVVMVPNFSNVSSTVTDSQGNTFTRHQTTSTATDVFTATAGSSGADTITYNNASAFPSGSTLLIFELVGTGAYHTGVTCDGNISSNTCTASITPSNSTNGFLEIATYTGSSASSYGATSLSINPQASLFDTWTTPTSTIQGKSYIYAPQTTSAVNIMLTGPTMGLNVSMPLVVVDFVQSSSAGSGPWVARKLTEGDLPSTAKAAIQSVNRYDMSASTLVITGANTANAIVSGTFTMPSDGCPCRILGSYNVYWDESGAGDTFDFWLSDGTNAWAPVERNVVSAAGPGVAASGMSPVSYSNSQSVTVTLYGASGTTADGTVRKAPANSVNPVNTGMVLTILQSIN